MTGNTKTFSCTSNGFYISLLDEGEPWYFWEIAINESPYPYVATGRLYKRSYTWDMALVALLALATHITHTGDNNVRQSTV